jgi:hypothetical protein
MLLLILKGHIIWSRPDGRGGTIYYHYYDQVTWVVTALAVLWIAWLLIRKYRRLRALRRPPRGVDYKLLKRVVKIKDELSSNYLRAGLSNNIHAVGIGRLAPGGDYCIQVFVVDATQELWPGAGTAALPGTFFRGIPLVFIQAAAMELLDTSSNVLPVLEQYASGIRDQQEVIIGGISGANVNLSGQSGTIGYFCKRKSKLRRRTEVCMLSNSHVFVDLQNPKADDTEMIVQPSPGERGSNRPIGTLINFSPLTFDGDTSAPNFIDAAVGKLWESQPHQPMIPSIGAVKSYVPQRDVEVGEAVRKCGRSTGYTEGRILSIYLDIWIRYDRTRQSAFFKNQFLIEPASAAYPSFVSKGDSGSLLVGAGEQVPAIGLIFAGTSQNPQVLPQTGNQVQTVEGCGVANPISEVLDRLKIELVI